MSTGNYQITGYTRDESSDNTRYVRRIRQNPSVQEQVMGIMNENHAQLSEGVRGCWKRVISIGATCVAEIDGQFFLLVEIEIDVPGEEIEQVIIFRINAAQALALLNAGVRRCIIVDTIPTSRPGVEVELICVFVVGNFAFLVFDVENNMDELVLVRVPLCTII